MYLYLDDGGRKKRFDINYPIFLQNEFLDNSVLWLCNMCRFKLVILFTNPSAIFKQSLTGWNAEFSFS